VVQAFLSFFYPQGTRKKIVKVAVPAKKRTKRGPKSTGNIQDASESTVVVLEGDSSAERFSIAEREFLNDGMDPGPGPSTVNANTSELPDEAKAAH